MDPRRHARAGLSRFAVGAMLLGTLAVPALAAPGWRTKVDPQLLARLESAASNPRGAGVPLMILLDHQADLDALDLGPHLDRAERGARVTAALRRAAEHQRPLLDSFAADRVAHRSFWIANVIAVRGDLGLVERLASRADVRRLEADEPVALEPPVPADPREPAMARDRDSIRGSGGIEWSLSHVKADQVWALGFTGQGVVIGGQDTGYDWTHPAVQSRYRGWDGVNATHDHNWHDAIHGTGGGSCGADSPEPCDDHNHGTHTMGTMLGDDGGSNRIGVAPGARWIGCRNMDVGNGTPSTYSECFEWFVAPTDLAGENADPSLAPDVINNSWSCPASEGCAFDTLRTVIANTRAAGIVVVTSAGNTGSACGSIANPPGIYEASFSIGATDETDAIASFSGRGPVSIDGSGRLKPDVSAPGVAIRSSIPGAAYATFNGTSMAAPHVAGLVALLLSARPDLAGDVDTIEALIVAAAQPLTSAQSCGDVAGTTVPNHTFGAGRIDALAMLTGDADGDGAANLTDCRPLDAAVWDAPTSVADLRAVAAQPTAFDWTPAAGADYDLVRSTIAADFAGASCVATGAAPGTAVDAVIPGSAAFYLLRARNACGSAIAPATGGVPRIVAACP